MNIVIDCGNTTAKVGAFDAGMLAWKRTLPVSGDLKSFLQTTPAANVVVSSVSLPADEILSWSVAEGRRLPVSYRLPLPINLAYRTPETLGVDRIAAACGAVKLFPATNCVVVDAGTCITYEFVDRDGNYRGGGISPGISMRFEAMHRLTARLPRVTPVHDAPLTGDTTETSMQSGVINGALAEVEGILRRYLDKFPGMRIILCGGDSVFFEKRLDVPIEVSPDLVLIGLHHILDHVISVS